MTSRWKLAAPLAAFALIAAACGDDAEPSPSPTTTAPPATTAPVTPPDTSGPQPTAPPTTQSPPGQVITGDLARADVPYSTSTTVGDEQIAELVAGNTEFALDLLRAIAADGDNTIMSPFSIAAALTMTYAGAPAPGRRAARGTQRARTPHRGHSPAGARR
jgi:hypothetical protein